MTAAAPPPSPPQGAACAAHPDRPALAVCARCGNFGCAACTAPSPIGPGRVCIACLERTVAPGGPTPWERRREIGAWRGLVETTREVVRRPAGFFRGLAREGEVGGAFGYAVILTLAGELFLFPLAAIEPVVELGGGEAALQIAWNAAEAVAIDVLGATLGTVIVAALAYAALRALGAGEAGLVATARVVGYATATSLASAPFLPLGAAAVGVVALAGLDVESGMIVGGVDSFAVLVQLVWNVAVMTVGFREVHRTTTGKALVAALVSFLFFCCSFATLGGAALLLFGTEGP